MTKPKIKPKSEKKTRTKKKKKPTGVVTTLTKQIKSNSTSIESIYAQMNNIDEAMNEHLKDHAGMWKPGEYDPSENQKGFIDDMTRMKIHHWFNYKGEFIVLRVFGGYIYFFENKSGERVATFVPVAGLDEEPK